MSVKRWVSRHNREYAEIVPPRREKDRLRCDIAEQLENHEQTRVSGDGHRPNHLPMAMETAACATRSGAATGISIEWLGSEFRTAATT
jgi:hypothetical protein